MNVADPASIIRPCLPNGLGVEWTHDVMHADRVLPSRKAILLAAAAMSSTATQLTEREERMGRAPGTLTLHRRTRWTSFELVDADGERIGSARLQRSHNPQRLGIELKLPGSRQHGGLDGLVDLMASDHSKPGPLNAAQLNRWSRTLHLIAQAISSLNTRSIHEATQTAMEAMKQDAECLASMDGIGGFVMMSPNADGGPALATGAGESTGTLCDAPTLQTALRRATGKTRPSFADTGLVRPEGVEGPDDAAAFHADLNKWAWGDLAEAPDVPGMLPAMEMTPSKDATSWVALRPIRMLCQARTDPMEVMNAVRDFDAHGAAIAAAYAGLGLEPPDELDEGARP